MAIDRTKIQKQAEAYMASGKVERAIDEFRKLLEDRPDDFNLMNRIGDAYLQIGRLPDALEMFKLSGMGFERSGFTNKAAAVFKKAHRAAPEDVDVSARLAETYRATNMIKDAIQIYIEVAEYFTKKGLLKRALEEFAKVVELDPKNLKNKVKLADLYNKEGVKERAAEIYLEVAEALAFEQMPAEAIQVLERAKAMTASPKVFLTQSRLCIVQKDLAGAAQHLREGLEANPRSSEILEALAEVELQAKAPERALEVLSQIPQLPEKATALCERALREMIRTNAIDEGLRLFKSIGREFARRGMGEQASRTIRASFQGIPVPLEAWIQLADIAHQSGDRQGRVDALSQAHALAMSSNDGALIRNLEEQLKGLGISATEIEAPPPPEAFQPTPGSASQGLPAFETTEIDPIKRMQIQQLQREAESYVRSRFNDRAQETYHKILELDPTNRDAINRIAEIHKASGVMTKVQQHYVKMAEKLAPMGQRHLALEMLDKAEELFPGSTRLHRRMLGLTNLAPEAPEPFAPPMPSAPAAIPLASGPSIPAEPSDLDVLIALDETRGSGRALLPPPPPPAPVVPSIALGVPGEPAAEPMALYPEDLQWTPPEDLLEEEILPSDAELPPEYESPEVEPPEIEPLELEPLPFAVGKVPVAPPQMPAPLAPTGEELASTLSDIDFQLDYGSPEEAKIEIQKALALWPGQPELLANLERAEEALRRLGHAPAPQAPAEEAELTHSFFDLTDVLGDSLLEPGEGEEMHDATNVVEKIHSVDELFDAFREGVEQQVKVDDYETHYNLGIAYKEMMLIEPALEEFKKAMRDPERTLECCSMLAICEQVQGNLESAAQWLRQGIEAPGFPPEDAIGLRYDLGETLVQMGRPEEARQHFQAVFELDPEYREVASKL